MLLDLWPQLQQATPPVEATTGGRGSRLVAQVPAARIEGYSVIAVRFTIAGRGTVTAASTVTASTRATSTRLTSPDMRLVAAVAAVAADHA